MERQSKDVKVYRIKNLTTGLYSTGGSAFSFSKTGNIWSNLGHLKNHLQHCNKEGLKKYSNCIVVESSLVDVVCDSFSIESYLFDKLL